MHSTTVVDIGALAHRHALGVSTHGSSLPPSWWLTRLVVGAVPRFVTAALARKIVRRSEEWADHAVWFRGARNEVIALAESKCSMLDPDLDLQKRLERLEAELLLMRKTSLDLIAHIGRLSGSRTGLFRDALRRLAAAATDLYEAVSAFKWEMLEFDADRAPRLNAPCEPQDIQHLLERL
jgi:hypothetical protein